MHQKPPSGGFLPREDISVSADHYIYTDYLDEFDRAGFESWCGSLGYEVELHPEFSIRDQGFTPIRFRADFLGEGSFLTGFELFSSENTSTDFSAPPVMIRKKPGFFARLFGKKEPTMAQAPEFKISFKSDEPSEFELAVRDKKWEVCASCCFHDPLEVLACYLFAGYFCETFGAVIDDPQLGRFYSKAWDIKLEFEAVKEDILANYKSWGQELIPFTGWENAEV